MLIKSDTSVESAMPTPLAEPGRQFAMRFGAAPLGVRLARRMGALRLHEWGVADGSDSHDVLVLIVGELCANAVRHGHVPGQDCRLRLATDGAIVRVEVTDARTGPLPNPVPTTAAAESGRGLLLVVGSASGWGWYPEAGGRGKTVWAELSLDGEALPSFGDCFRSDT
ncbi:ATP-binding protein [Embleya sp. AB8]|uniref:ATP-binding protein n=1 Tax=Embleya sp. AB8 TaxID=3156304 RepID=UPI003C78D0F8